MVKKKKKEAKTVIRNAGVKVQPAGDRYGEGLLGFKCCTWLLSNARPYMHHTELQARTHIDMYQEGAV